MNICIISPYPPQSGGVPIHTESLVKHLSKEHKVFLITYGRFGRHSHGNVKIIEVPIIDVKFLRGLSFFLGAFFRLRGLVKHEKIDVIHSQFMHPPGTVGSFYRWFHGKKPRFVVTAHGSDLLSLAQGRIGRSIIKCVGKRCDRLICVSEYLSKEAQKLGISRKKTTLIYNGLEDRGLPKASKESLRKVLNLPDRKIVTFSGKLSEAKGADIFLILAEHFARKGDVHFILVGDGPARDDLEGFCKKMAITKSVSFVGEKSHQDSLKYMKASDVVVVPSRIEGFGLTALEAMRMGVPVIAFPNGALPEIMPDIAVTENMPHTVKKIIESRKFREALVKRNREASKKFTLEKMFDETDRIYKKRL
ncbi:MAG: glycosyltransferase family 4 protein [Candidatus Aenigmatarchaeota archaeon]|nr:MAG: glycosyltransferase family 4 protein [Candidatus Aenigmarchaeota archaeon]